MRHTFLPLLIAATLVVPPAFSGDRHELKVDFINADGEEAGYALLRETPNGVVVSTRFENLMPGWHAFHIHGTGQCALPDFSSAGGHFNPDNHEHGFENPKGPHAGDLPNIYVGEDGKLRTEFLVDGVHLKEGDKQLLDQDGAALVIHEGIDDYSTTPAGDAGNRMACGAISASEERDTQPEKPEAK